MSKTHSPWMILVTVAIGTLLVGLDKTVVNLALPSIISAFHISISTAGWIATIYMLTNAVFIPIFGKLSDTYGAKKIYTLGFISFIIISLLTGLSWNIYILIFFRALQGIAGASVYPTSMALLTEGFKEKQKRAEALGAWVSIIAGSIIIGPLLGGPLIDHFSWRSVFYINLPIGIIASLLIYFYLPPNISGQAGKFDYKGTFLLTITITSLLLALDQGTSWGWTSLSEIFLYILSIIFAYLFIKTEKSSNNPLIDPKFAKNKTLISVLVASFISYGILLSFMYAISILVQKNLHISATANGYILLPLLIALAIVSPFGGRLTKYLLPKYIVMIGLIFATIGFFIVANLSELSVLNLILPLSLMGVGFGLCSSPLNTATTMSVPQNEVGIASGLLNLVRNVAGVFGVAYFTILLSMGATSHAMFFSAGIIMIFSIIAAYFIKESSRDFV